MHVPEVPPRAINLIGQSNAGGGAATPDTTWGGQPVQTGWTVRINGINVTTWPSVTGPGPYLIEEAIADGVTTGALNVRYQSGASIVTMNNVMIPGAVADRIALGLEGYDAVVLWQGENEAVLEADALAYDEATKLPRFLDLSEQYWPGCPVYLMELLTVHASAPYHATVRTSVDNVLAVYTDATLVATRTPTPLATVADGVHATPNAGGGYEEAAARMWAAMVAP